jgi:hypothetical protein
MDQLTSLHLEIEISAEALQFNEQEPALSREEGLGLIRRRLAETGFAEMTREQSEDYVRGVNQQARSRTWRVAGGSPN